jgi:hypothetical protein
VTVLPYKPLNPVAPLPLWQPDAWPITRMMNPLGGATSVKYLLASVVAARCAVGMVRIIADWPANNPTDAPKRDKVMTFLERVFMEGLGTLGTFVVLHASQDLAVQALDRLDPKLHPVQVLKQWQQHLSGPALATVTQGLAKAMGVEASTPGAARDALLACHSSVAKVLYYGADIAPLRQHLALDKALSQQALPAAEAYFSRLNVAGKLPLLTGLTMGTLFGGVLWQSVNDAWFRKRIVPALTNLWLTKTTPKANDDTPATPWPQTTLGQPPRTGLTHYQTTPYPATQLTTLVPAAYGVRV